LANADTPENFNGYDQEINAFVECCVKSTIICHDDSVDAFFNPLSNEPITVAPQQGIPSSATCGDGTVR
jgi:hypothetical protein